MSGPQVSDLLNTSSTKPPAAGKGGVLHVAGCMCRKVSQHLCTHLRVGDLWPVVTGLREREGAAVVARPRVEKPFAISILEAHEGISPELGMAHGVVLGVLQVLQAVTSMT